MPQLGRIGQAHRAVAVLVELEQGDRRLVQGDRGKADGPAGELVARQTKGLNGQDHLVALEPRIHSAVIALAGGDLPGILRTSDERRLVRFREAKMEEQKLDEDGFEARLREVLWTDPLEVGATVDPRKVMMVTTRWDEVVLPTYQDRLWEAFGKPLRYDLPTGHYAGIVYLPYVTDVISTWLRARLGIHAKD